MLPVSRFAPNGNPRRATVIAVARGRRLYAQWIVQSRSEDRPAAPDVPGDVPWHQRPRREQRQHPRRVDVRQEGAGRAVRVAAAEPDANRGPVRPGIGAGRLAARDEPCRQAAERDDQERHREDPPPIVEAFELVAERPAHDRGASPPDPGPGGDGRRPVGSVRRVPRRHAAAFWQTPAGSPSIGPEPQRSGARRRRTVDQSPRYPSPIRAEERARP